MFYFIKHFHSVFLFIGCRALTSLLLSSATKTGFGCISWLMATTVTVDSAHIIKVRRVKSDYLHGDDYLNARLHAHTHAHGDTVYAQRVHFWKMKWDVQCVHISAFNNSYFQGSDLASFAFFFGIFVFVFLSDSWSPSSLPQIPSNYICWLQTSRLFSVTFSLTFSILLSFSHSSLYSLLFSVFFPSWVTIQVKCTARFLWHKNRNWWKTLGNSFGIFHVPQQW